jgi:hypothetical protein
MAELTRSDLRPHIDGYDLTQRLEEYSALLEALTHSLKGAVAEVNTAQDVFYRAQTDLKKSQLKLRAIQMECRNIQSQSMNTQSVLRAVPR